MTQQHLAREALKHHRITRAQYHAISVLPESLELIEALKDLLSDSTLDNRIIDRMVEFYTKGL